MKKILILGFGIVLVAVAFYAGRFSAPAPQFQASDNTDDPMENAWQDFIRAQQDALTLLKSHEFYGNDQERAEAYRGILYGLVGAIKMGVLAEHDHPRFMSAADLNSKSGLDNPDNNYYIALIRDDSDYLITGHRGTSQGLVFQLVVGQPGVKGAGSSTNVSVLYDDQIQYDDDGRFEILVSPNQPMNKVNWLPSGDGAEALLVRFTHSDWANESPGHVKIEKIGAEGSAPPPLSSERMAEKLTDAAINLYDRTATWLSFAKKAWLLMPRNGISNIQATSGGLVGQYSAFGTWDLQEDQAIVLTVPDTGASYQGIELGNLWFVSLDYESRTSSLTLDQAYKSSDGNYYFVITANDPGIQNWLDTEAHQRGIVMMRWQGLSSPPVSAQQPSAEVIDISQLSEKLPADTPTFSEEQRAAQIQSRRKQVHARFN